MNNRRAFGAALLAALLLHAPAHAAARYDLVITGGLVMDPETGLRAVRDVGIQSGKITAISTRRLDGARTIQATGRVVAPGFIDLHAHGQSLLDGRVQAFDGVTTALECEAGQWPIDAAYADAARTGRAIHYGFTVSWALARAIVLTGAAPDGSWTSAMRAWSDEQAQGPATSAQTEQTLTLLARGLAQGAIGIGLLTGYMPGAAPEELYEVSKLASRRDVTVFTHLRSTVDDFFATEEAIALSAVTGAHWHIAHVYWDSSAQVDLIAHAMRAGVRITPETKGWFSGSTFVSAAFLQPDVLKKAGATPDLIYYGRPITDFDDLARVQRDDPRALVITREPDDDVHDPAKRAETARRLTTRGWSLASDGMPWTDPQGRLLPPATWPLPPDAWAHPRSAGNFARIIQTYVVQWKLADLMDVLRAGALNPALELQESVPQMRRKGRVQVGADADLIVFDPNRVRATATEEHPAALAEGMDYVLVDGQPVIEHGTLTLDAKPGRPIRRGAH